MSHLIIHTPSEEPFPVAIKRDTDWFVDTFAADVRRGHVLGTSLGGVLRKGIDVEGVISIDHGALRIEPTILPGWGRSGIAYGPYPRANGLAFHSLVLNGHNISRTEPMRECFRERMRRWLKGSETHPPMTRLAQWIKAGKRRHMWRRMRQWMRSASGYFHWPILNENLAVGWFPAEAPQEPLQQGNSLVMHAVVPDGGELWARVGAASAPLLRGLQNVPIYYTVVLRESGAAYYVGSPFPLPGLKPFPFLRLIGIDPFCADKTLCAGIHQAALGEIGFRVDTRVYGTQVGVIPELSKWYGSARAADMLTGDGPVDSSMSELGQPWIPLSGTMTRSPRGATGNDLANSAMLEMGEPAGLVHALIDCGADPGAVAAIIWRARDRNNYWRFEVGPWHSQLSCVQEGQWHRFPRMTGRHLAPNTVSSLQVLDDGQAVSIYLNGNSIFGNALSDDRLNNATGAGVSVTSSSSGIAVRSFEAHPRELQLPGLRSFSILPHPFGQRVVIFDDFAGAPGELNGRRTTVGDGAWRREVGRGVFEVTGDNSARVNATPDAPCPGRTAYMVGWSNASFADIEVTITPPGKCRGTRQKGRSGIVLWQDKDNYIAFTEWVQDSPAISVAAFLRFRGYEELFDAVWTNLGDRIHWGEPHRLRVLFDKQTFVVHINDEPVLYRALTDIYQDWKEFTVHRAGIIANWEWGTDTGTCFQNFIGRDNAC